MKHDYMKSAKILLFAIFLSGLGFFTVPQNTQAQDINPGQCCVCYNLAWEGVPGHLSSVSSCSRYMTQDACAAKSTQRVYGEEGAISGTKCSLESCLPEPYCPKSQSKGVKAPKQTDLIFTPNVPLPGFTQTDVDNSLLGNYINALYKFFVGVAGILAVIMIAVGGLLWLFSSGDSGKITKAKEIIIGSIIGLMLVLGSYLILNTINPALVTFKPLDVNIIGQAHVGDFCEPDEEVIVDGRNDIGQNLRCGQKATVKGSNQTCIGRGCPGEEGGEVCYFSQAMQEAKCLKCQDTDDDVMALYGIPESDAGCNLLTPLNQPIGQFDLCVYTESSAADFNDGGCVLLKINCDNINLCSKYDDTTVNDSEWFGGTNIDNLETRHLDRICTENIDGNPSRTGICPAIKQNGGSLWLSESEICYMYDSNDCRQRALGQGESVASCPSEQLVIRIPSLGNKVTIVNADPRLLPETIEKLRAVVNSLGGNERLVIKSAYRTNATQAALFSCYQRANGGACPPDCGSCNEASEPSCTTAPHQLGKAIDVCIQGGPNGVDTCRYIQKACNDGACLTGEAKDNLIADQEYLQELMQTAGFSRYCGEWWHFEYPAVSTVCEPGVYR